MSLENIGKRHRADKFGRETRHFFSIYEEKFEPFRAEPLKILEIGVKHGASLRTWAEYFPRARIHGVDISPKCKAYETDRIKIFIGDQGDVGFLRSLEGDYNIIIDDGGHRMSQQITGFQVLFKEKLAPGGVYVIEDLHTSYWPRWGGSYNGKNTTVTYLKKLVDCCNFEAYKCDQGHSGRPVEKPNYFDRSIDSIEFRKNICFLRKIGRKQGKGEKRDRQEKPKASNPERAVFAKYCNKKSHQEPCLDVCIVKYTPSDRDKEHYQAFLSQLSSHPVSIIEHDNNKDNIGLSRARNELIQRSKSDVLCFLDFDINLNQVDFPAMAKKARSEKCIVSPLHRSIPNAPEFVTDWRMNNTLFLASRSAIEEIGGFDERLFVFFQDEAFKMAALQTKIPIYRYSQSTIKHLGFSRQNPQKRTMHRKDHQAFCEIWGPIHRHQGIVNAIYDHQRYSTRLDIGSRTNTGNPKKIVVKPGDYDKIPPGQKFDLIYIDGPDHAFDTVMKEFELAESLLADEGTICLHDLCPLCEYGANPSSVPGPWCGEVWRVFAELRMTRPDLEMWTVNFDYGVGIIKKGRQKLLKRPKKPDYAWLDAHRAEALNLISLDEFIGKR